MMETEVTHTPPAHDSKLEPVQDPRRVMDRAFRRAFTLYDPARTRHE